METVGQILRAEREKQNLSISEVEKATSIRALYITSIEEDQYKVIPGEVYLKGFIRNYANFLGLNGPELVELYRQTQKPPEEEAEPIAQTPQPIKQDSLGRSFPSKLVAMVILLVAVVGIGFWAYQSSGKTPGPMPAPEAKTQQPAQVPPTPTTATKPADAKPVYVQAKFTAECWTLVTADGKQLYEGIPKINESFTWQADKTLVIKAGNAAAVDVTFNGQSQGKLGTKGDVVVKTFTPTGVK
ncbi:MAG: DUF4115 domain-containing protein [Sporomusaceae bacterium]|nr:DUF4115 domain-containing protein [Sporomusaceae bacterium]